MQGMYSIVFKSLGYILLFPIERLSLSDEPAPLADACWFASQYFRRYKRWSSKSHFCHNYRLNVAHRWAPSFLFWCQINRCCCRWYFCHRRRIPQIQSWQSESGYGTSSKSPLSVRSMLIKDLSCRKKNWKWVSNQSPCTFWNIFDPIANRLYAEMAYRNEQFENSIPKAQPTNLARRH